MNAMIKAISLTQNALHDFGIEVDTIEIMHWIIVIQDSTMGAM